MPDPRIFPVERENFDQVIVGAGAVVVLAANEARVGLDLTNVSTPSAAISLGFGNVPIANSGKVLTVYGSTYHMGTENLFLGAITAICPDGGLLAYSEEVKV